MSIELLKAATKRLPSILLSKKLKLKMCKIQTNIELCTQRISMKYRNRIERKFYTFIIELCGRIGEAITSNIFKIYQDKHGLRHL